MDVDLQKTAVLHALLSEPAEARDDQWIARLEAEAPDASLAAGTPQVEHGPDGFPYFQLHIPPPNQPFDAFSVSQVVPVCTERGFGCVLNGVDGAPPWVLTYGNLWSLRATGAFGTGRGSHKRAPEGQVLGATPSQELFPDWARAVLRSWLAHEGLADVGMVLIVDQTEDGPVDWLSFSIFPDDFPDEASYRNVMDRLHWFLPPRFAVLGVARGVLLYERL